MVKKSPVNELNRHDVLCGTAHSFQGEERDIMILSFCLDNDSHSTGFRHINRADVFNVSVTRARSKVYVLSSFDFSKLPKGALLPEYLAFEKVAVQKEAKLQEKHDLFMEEVKQALESAGFTTKVGYEVADLSLDLAVIMPDEMVAVDLIGYQGIYEEALSLTSYKVLHRAGIRTFPLPFSFWKLDQQRCLDAVITFLNRGSES